MYMYNPEGDKALVMPDQVKALTAAGWTKEEPAKKATKKTEPVAGSDESSSESNASEESGSDETGTDAGKAPAEKRILLKKK